MCECVCVKRGNRIRGWEIEADDVFVHKILLIFPLSISKEVASFLIYDAKMVEEEENTKKN
jgi:hypothetical protein